MKKIIVIKANQIKYKVSVIIPAVISEKSDFVMGFHFHNNGSRQMKINILHYCDDTSDIININPLKDQINFNRTSHNHVAPWGKIFNKQLMTMTSDFLKTH